MDFHATPQMPVCPILEPQVWDSEGVVIIPDHYIFTADPRANRNVDILRDFVNQQASVECTHLTKSYLYVLFEMLSLSTGPATRRYHQLTVSVAGFSPARVHVDVLRNQDIKYFYDITDRGNFKVNPDYKGVCHVALAQEGHTRPGEVCTRAILCRRLIQWIHPMSSSMVLEVIERLGCSRYHVLLEN